MRGRQVGEMQVGVEASRGGAVRGRQCRVRQWGESVAVQDRIGQGGFYTHRDLVPHGFGTHGDFMLQSKHIFVFCLLELIDWWGSMIRTD